MEIASKPSRLHILRVFLFTILMLENKKRVKIIIKLLQQAIFNNVPHRQGGNLNLQHHY
jgi:hypothetical protein